MKIVKHIKAHTGFRGVVMALFMAVCAWQAAAQAPTFSKLVTPAMGNPITADFNGDGRLDLAGGVGQGVAVALGNGNGTFQPYTVFPAASYTQNFVAGDFNSDGRQDIIATINSRQFNLSLLIGNGDGTFLPPVNFANTLGADSASIIAADLNNDVRLDVVILHTSTCNEINCTPSNLMTVMLGNGNGTFQTPQNIAVDLGMSDVEVGDFNRDGLKDLAIAAYNAQVYILFGVGNGTFTRQPNIRVVAPTTDPLFSNAQSIKQADFNADGIDDLAVTLPTNNHTTVLIGKADGTFKPPLILITTQFRDPQFLTVGDFNLDGKLDIAEGLAWAYGGIVSIWTGIGDGTFRQPVFYFPVPPDQNIAAGDVIMGDFNGDTRPDLTFQEIGTGTNIEILLNTTQSTPAPIGIATLTLSTQTINGGNPVSGLVTLTDRPQTNTTVRLTSSNTAATVPVSVVVPAGALSASFTINTTQVSAPTAATITANLNDVSKSIALTINPVAATPDTINITLAEFKKSRNALTVEASGSRTNAVLQVFTASTNQLIGTLTNNGKGRFSGQFNMNMNPRSIIVRSNFGGQATRVVMLK